MFPPSGYLTLSSPPAVVVFVELVPAACSPSSVFASSSGAPSPSPGSTLASADGASCLLNL